MSRIGVRLTLTGSLAAASLLPWIQHRAERLDLVGWVRQDTADQVTIEVHGPAPLVDAMEIACSLGPADALVDSIARHDMPLQSEPNGFQQI